MEQWFPQSIQRVTVASRSAYIHTYKSNQIKSSRFESHQHMCKSTYQHMRNISYSITYLAPCRVILHAGLQAFAQPGARKLDVGGPAAAFRERPSTTPASKGAAGKQLAPNETMVSSKYSACDCSVTLRIHTYLDLCNRTSTHTYIHAYIHECMHAYTHIRTLG